MEILSHLIDTFNGRRIGIVGDLMLDHYMWSSVERISPEAPVPIAFLRHESYQLGGAGNVAINIRQLGGVPVIFGAVGHDSFGHQIIEILENNGMPIDGIIVDQSRSSTVKTRVIAENHQLLRIDREQVDPLSRETSLDLLARFESLLDGLDAVIIEDYNKGVVTEPVIKSVTGMCRSANKIVTVDPKFYNFFEYQGVTVFKPNLNEFERAIGKRLGTFEERVAASRELVKRLNAQYVLLTLGEAGMLLTHQSGEHHHIPTKAIEVYDVSGAGDTTIAVMTLALAGGGQPKESAALANYAAGVVCG
ncbi:MAG TPA: PfkB family carbohydrate kinase, partial [Blastocatellia bacterium]|nr:PfkB family carbohydrate kinase [Blastocatellia bacterium]